MNNPGRPPGWLAALACRLQWLLEMPARVAGWIIDRAEYLFGSLLASLAEFAGLLVSIAALVPRRFSRSLTPPVSSTAERASEQTWRIVERAEWVWGSFCEYLREFGQLFGGLLRLLPWRRLAFLLIPWRFAGRILRSCFGAVAERAEYLVGDWLAGVSDVSRSLFHLGVRMPLAMLARALKSVLPAWFVDLGHDILGGIPAFGRAYFCSRDTWKLLFGTPALMLAVPVIAGLAISQGDSTADKLVRYRVKLESALAENDQQVVDLCLRRLEQLGYLRREREQFRAALLVESTSGARAALPRMQEIARAADGSLYTPAQIWIARRLLDGEVSDGSVDPITAARNHLTLVLEHEPESAWATSLLAETHVREDELHRAIDLLHEVADHDEWLVHWRLMQLCLAQGRHKDATSAAQRLVSHFERLPLANEADASCSAYLAWAEALQASGDRERAFDVYGAIVRKFPDDDRIDLVIEQLVLAGLEQRPTWAQEFYLLRPTSEALHRLFAAQLVSDEASLNPFLEQCRRENKLSHMIYELAADSLAARQEYDRALQYYQRACELHPAAAKSWNNSAWILANVKGRLEEALQAANKAIQIERDADFYDTRGQIYAQLKRWHDARSDLEFALNGTLTDALATHQVLARAYQALGESGLALAHWQGATRDR